MTAAIGWQIFGRKVLNDSPAWSEPLAMLLLLYCVLLGAAAGVREGFHLRLRLLESLLSAKRVVALGRAVDALVAGFGVLMVLNGLALAEFMGGHLIPTLGVSRAMTYWPFIVSGALIAVFAFDNLVRRPRIRSGV